MATKRRINLFGFFSTVYHSCFCTNQFISIAIIKPFPEVSVILYSLTIDLETHFKNAFFQVWEVVSLRKEASSIHQFKYPQNLLKYYTYRFFEHCLYLFI